MKKKIIILLALIAFVAVGIYLYAYKGHRDITTETADFSISVSNLQAEFAANDSVANAKYADKTIQISGKISAVDASTKAVVIDDKLFGTFEKTVPSNLNVGNKVTVKGRFLGYDELLEEFKMDQISIVE